MWTLAVTALAPTILIPRKATQEVVPWNVSLTSESSPASPPPPHTCSHTHTHIHALTRLRFCSTSLQRLAYLWGSDRRESDSCGLEECSSKQRTPSASQVACQLGSPRLSPASASIRRASPRYWVKKNKPKQVFNKCSSNLNSHVLVFFPPTDFPHRISEMETTTWEYGDYNFTEVPPCDTSSDNLLGSHLSVLFYFMFLFSLCGNGLVLVIIHR